MKGVNRHTGLKNLCRKLIKCYFFPLKDSNRTGNLKQMILHGYFQHDPEKFGF